MKDCETKVYCRDVCKKHYNRLLKYGDPSHVDVSTRFQTVDPATRLKARSAPAANGCIEWQGPVLNIGYGQISINGKGVQAHRLAYSLEHGEIPEGLFICHHCDNRRCVNPEHLYAGTAKDNAKDREDRNRSPDRNGHKSPLAKLTPDQVRYMRYSDRSHAELAVAFGVTATCVSLARRRKTYKNVV